MNKTIEEVKVMKAQFEAGIAKAIEVFETEAGCQITEIVIIKTDMHYGVLKMIDIVAKIEL